VLPDAASGTDRASASAFDSRPKHLRRLAHDAFIMRTCVRDVTGLLFVRACERRNVPAAEMAALEMRPLSLKDALSLVCLYAAEVKLEAADSA
jgi:hypothetical protein